MAATDAVGFQDQLDSAVEGLAIECHRLTFLKAHPYFFGLDDAVVTPERNTHDGVDDLDAAVEVFQVLGLVRGAQHVGVG